MNPNGVMGDIARVNTMNQRFGGQSVGGVRSSSQPRPPQNRGFFGGLMGMAQRFLRR